APDGAVIHQAMLEEYLLAAPHIVAGKHNRAGGIDHLRRNGRCVLVCLDGQVNHDTDTEKERERNGASPPTRQLFCVRHGEPFSVRRLTSERRIGLMATAPDASCLRKRKSVSN